MASPLQFEANRRNARHSTGPRSPQGKAASAQNALKHGMRSRHIVLPNLEDPQEFEQLRRAFAEVFRPANPVEACLVDRMAAAEWRLRRLQRIECALLDNAVDKALSRANLHPSNLAGESVAQDVLSGAYYAVQGPYQQIYKFQAQLERSHERAFREFQKLRKHLPDAPNEPIRDASETKDLTPVAADPHQQAPSHPAAVAVAVAAGTPPERREQTQSTPVVSPPAPALGPALPSGPPSPRHRVLLEGSCPVPSTS